eukprot:554722-Prorocentrum_minimum.AAC.1
MSSSNSFRLSLRGDGSTPRIVRRRMDQSDAGSAGMFSRRTNQTQEAQTNTDTQARSSVYTAFFSPFL